MTLHTVDHWRAVYDQNPRLAAGGITLERFLEDPVNILAAAAYDTAMPLPAGEDFYPLLPRQKAVRERIDGLPQGRRYADLRERIIANTVVSRDRFWKAPNGEVTPCWEWTGATVRNRSGKRYGKIAVRIKRGPNKGKLKTWLVHRLVLVVFKGRRMSKRSVGMHFCDYTLCANPDHLGGGSQKKSVRDCVDKGRHYTPWRKAA